MKLILVTIQLFFKQPTVKTSQLLILTNRIEKLITHLVIAGQREILAAEITVILSTGSPAWQRKLRQIYSFPPASTDSGNRSHDPGSVNIFSFRARSNEPVH